jgi:transcriptional regulator of acetoin/glycerol metabolism
VSKARLLSAVELAEARRKLLAEGTSPGPEVPDTIVASWRRSAGYGLDMETPPSVEALSYRQLREAQERSAQLLRAARAEIEALYQDARQSGAIVILTDATGVILATVGNIEFAERAARVALRPGVDWDEATIGTNAIGTAIAEGREIAVTGAEHYFTQHAILSCSAVPILDPRGRIAGVLDLSNGAEVPQTHTLALVRRAVQQIERRLFDAEASAFMRLHVHADRLQLGGAHEGVLAFDRERLVAANRAGLGLIGLDWSALGRIDFDQIFSGTRDRLIDEDVGALKTTAGSTLFARLEVPRRPPPPVTTEAAPAPGTVDFTPILDDAMQRLLDRAVRLADADVAVLVQGEVGTGKDTFVRHLHARGRRRDGPLIIADCAALGGDTLGRTLFGGVVPSPTEPATAWPGLIARAASGTLVLVGVEALAPAVQRRLARVLRDGMLRLNDGETTHTLDCGVVTISEVRLSDLAARGAVITELYLQLSAYTVDLAPVRRHPDRAGLIRGLWTQVATAAAAERMQAETLALLAAYEWPGNFRQIMATLRALAVLAEAGEAIGPDALPQEIRGAPRPGGDNAPVAVEVGLDSITLAAMRAALDAEKGNVSRAARRLGIHRSTLYRRLFGSEAPKPAAS